MVASHPRLTALLAALLIGTAFNLAVCSALTATGTLAQAILQTEWIALVAAPIAAGLFGPWIRRREDAAWRRAVISGIACPMLTFVAAAAIAVLKGRTERALAHGLAFGSPGYFDFIFEGHGALSILGQFVAGLVGSIVVGSVVTAFLPEIVGGFAGHWLWVWAGPPRRRGNDTV